MYTHTLSYLLMSESATRPSCCTCAHSSSVRYSMDCCELRRGRAERQLSYFLLSSHDFSVLSKAYSANTKHSAQRSSLHSSTTLPYSSASALLPSSHTSSYTYTHLVFPGRNLSNYDSLILNLPIKVSAEFVSHHKVLSPEFKHSTCKVT